MHRCALTVKGENSLTNNRVIRCASDGQFYCCIPCFVAKNEPQICIVNVTQMLPFKKYMKCSRCLRVNSPYAGFQRIWEEARSRSVSNVKQLWHDTIFHKSYTDLTPGNQKPAFNHSDSSLKTFNLKKMAPFMLICQRLAGVSNGELTVAGLSYVFLKWGGGLNQPGRKRRCIPMCWSLPAFPSMMTPFSFENATQGCCFVPVTIC